MSTQRKLALVTGSSRGIGLAISKSLDAQGLLVVGTATTEQGARQLQEHFQSLDMTARAYALDVTDALAVEQLINKIQTEHGAIDVLVNNAGITQDNLLLRLKETEWDQVIDTNLKGVFRLSQAVLRGMMKNRWGRIISISSVVASSGNAGQTNYAAAKAGLEGFSKSLAREVGSRGITVNVVAPGYIQTDMTDNLSQINQTKLLEQVPIKRMGNTQDVAHAVCFLASDGSAYITGETIHVNGGMLMV